MFKNQIISRFLPVILAVLSAVALSCSRVGDGSAVAVGNAYMDALMQVDVQAMAGYAAPGIADEFLKIHAGDTAGYHDMLRDGFVEMGNVYVLDSAASRVERTDAGLVYAVSRRDADGPWVAVRLWLDRQEGAWRVTDMRVEYTDD